MPRCTCSTFCLFSFRQAAPGALLQHPTFHNPKKVDRENDHRSEADFVHEKVFLEKEENQAALSRIAGIAFSGWNKEEKMRHLSEVK